MKTEEEIDEWLEKVDDVYKKVSDVLDGKIDLEKLKKEEEYKKKEEKLKKFLEDKKKEEEIEKQRDLLKKGRKGKGEKNDYELFCDKCFTEYVTNDVSVCYNCKHNLISREERHRRLKEKVEVLKENKIKKTFRKKNYENWLKSQNIVKNQFFSNYAKWDLYESSEDEEEKGEPILPKDDPNFRALEKDLTDAQKARELSRKKANTLKEEGNALMSQGNYDLACVKYTQAIEESRNIMVLYTNRALCYIRLEKFENAVKDCNRVIEYLDIFEEELNNNKELYAKAQSRKAQALYNLKQYSEALESINAALDIFSNEDLIKLKKSIELEKTVQEDALEALKKTSESSVLFSQLDTFIDTLSTNIPQFQQKYSNTSKDFQKIKIIIDSDDQNKNYFYLKGGLQLIMSNLIDLPYLLEIIQCFNKEDKYKLILNSNKVYQKLVFLMFSNELTRKNHSNIHKIILNICDILETASLFEPSRKTLAEIANFDKLFNKAIDIYDFGNCEVTKNEDNLKIISVLFIFVGNLCYSSKVLKNQISQNSSNFFDKFASFVKNFENNSKNLDLLENILSFCINMCLDQHFREKFKERANFFITFLIGLLKETAENKIFIETNETLIEKIFCLFYNISYLDELNQFYIDLGLGDILKQIYSVMSKKGETCICNLRIIMLWAKLSKKYVESLGLTQFFNEISRYISIEVAEIIPKLTESAIKLLVHYFINLNDKEKESLSEEDINVLVKNSLKMFIRDIRDKESFDKNEERIINCLSLFIKIVDKFPHFSDSYIDIVLDLIYFAKEKLGLLRSNSAILLAKLMKTSEKIDRFSRDNHGMDVLMNVSKFLNLKNKS